MVFESDTRQAILPFPRRRASAVVLHSHRSGLFGIAAIALIAALIACGQTAPSTPAPLAPMPTVEATVTEVPTAVQDVVPDTPTTEATSVGDNLPSPTLEALSTPVVTPEYTPVIITPIATTLPPTPTAKPASVATVKPVAAESQHEAPIELNIPKIGVKASVESVGLDRAGAMATPSGPFTVGWWKHGVVPGDPGNAVIDGHLDSAVYGAAVFWRLGDLRAGDKILVRMPGNRTLTFVVDHSAVYPFDNAPLADIFGASATSSLNLITCSGSFDRSSRNYDRRLVVYAKLQKT